MSKTIDLTGKKFNMLTVIEKDHSVNGRIYWKCTCDCGNETIVSGNNLKSGRVKSCGCLQHVAYNRIHGESNTSLYRHWISMIYRCENPKNFAYKWYGARGIKVCDAWKTFEGFKEWVMKTRPCDGYSVERIDVNGDYCPENCKWIPLKEQARNRTTARIIEYNGESKSLQEWCEDLGLNYKRVHNRITKLHWSFEDAISRPVESKKRNEKGKRIYG